MVGCQIGHGSASRIRGTELCSISRSPTLLYIRPPPYHQLHCPHHPSLKFCIQVGDMDSPPTFISQLTPTSLAEVVSPG